MIPEIHHVQTLLLDSLLERLKIDKPNFVETLKQGNAENYYNFKNVENELDVPIQPWSELLDSFLDFQLGLDFCTLSIEKLSTANNGRELHFYRQTYVIYLYASLERLKNFILKLNRKKILINTNHILNYIEKTLKYNELTEARHTATHGRFTGTSKPIADTLSEHYWEPHAVIRLDETHIEGWHIAHQNKEEIVLFYKDEFNKFNQSVINMLRNIIDLLKLRNM